MTGEEIVEQVRCIVYGIGPVRYTSPKGLNEHGRLIGQALLPIFHTVISQAYEEAMKADCLDCERGLPVEARDGLYYHPHPEVGDESLCEASGVRALKDSLST